MRHFIPIIIALTFVVSSCSKSGGEETQPEPEQFHIDIRLKTTPVKSQGASDLCWIYAMLATIETEHLMAGDSIDLSAIFLGRRLLEEQTLRHYANENAPITLRGMMPTTLRLLQRHGAMPFTSYRQPKDANLRSLARQLQQRSDQARAHRKGMQALAEDTQRLLDDAIGPVPSWVFMLGCQYTYLEFAHSICQPREYTALTSFTHHPFGSKFVLEVPDNNYGEEFLNVPIDTLMTYIDHALRTRHPVCWEGDTSEPGFGHGIAVLPEGHKSVTQDSRQRMFDHFDTTDNHCMAIIGLAHDDHGKKYYICKNSWGKNTAYGGYVYMEEDYLKAKTIAVVIPSKAIYNQP